MVDKNLLAPASVEKKLNEIVGKYLGIVEFFAGIEQAEKSLDLEEDEAIELGWPSKDQLLKAIWEKKTNLKYQEPQMTAIYEEFFPKYKHFCDIIGKKCTEETIEVWWVCIHKALIVEEALEQFIVQFNDRLVECEWFFFSLPYKIAHNDPIKDADNIKHLEFKRQQTEISVEDTTKKLFIFTTLLWSLKK